MNADLRASRADIRFFCLLQERIKREWEEEQRREKEKEEQKQKAIKEKEVMSLLMELNIH